MTTIRAVTDLKRRMMRKVRKRRRRGTRRSRRKRGRRRSKSGRGRTTRRRRTRTMKLPMSTARTNAVLATKTKKCTYKEEKMILAIPS